LEKKKEHIVLQIINIIKLQHKNATILIRIVAFLFTSFISDGISGT
jgi:hypothetical protein